MPKGDWIQTFTGKRWWVIDPQPADVDVRDIAHALARICRFGGHVEGRTYTVAQHCVMVSDRVYEKTGSLIEAFAGLMHDATEAYVGDMVSPLKRHIPQFQEVEARVWQAIVHKWPVLPLELPASVHVADKRMCSTEARDLLSKPHPEDWVEKHTDPYPHVRVCPWGTKIAEKRYLALWLELAQKIGGVKL